MTNNVHFRVSVTTKGDVYRGEVLTLLSYDFEEYEAARLFYSASLGASNVVAVQWHCVASTLDSWRSETYFRTKRLDESNKEKPNLTDEELASLLPQSKSLLE